MSDGYLVQYSEDQDEICIIPKYHIPMDHFIELVRMYGQQGYKWWLPADERGGYIFSKEKRKNESIR